MTHAIISLMCRYYNKHLYRANYIYYNSMWIWSNARYKQMIQIKHNKLRIPTCGRLTSWLFTKRGGVEFGATKDKSIQWQGGRFEPGPQDYKSSALPLGHARLPRWDVLGLRPVYTGDFCRGNSMQFLSQQSCIKFETCSKPMWYRDDKSHWKSHLVYTCDFEVAI